MWRYPLFAFICCVSIHLEISAMAVRSAPEELPIRIRTTSFRSCEIGQGYVAKTEESEGMSGSWRADRWLETISYKTRVVSRCRKFADCGRMTGNPETIQMAEKPAIRKGETELPEKSPFEQVRLVRSELTEHPVLHALRHRLGIVVQQDYFRLSRLSDYT
jgi:hypothetical protein